MNLEEVSYHWMPDWQLDEHIEMLQKHVRQNGNAVLAGVGGSLHALRASQEVLNGLLAERKLREE
jgi:fructoselysine-6-P-deglycase FrlB-like protein